MGLHWLRQPAPRTESASGGPAATVLARLHWPGGAAAYDAFLLAVRHQCPACGPDDQREACTCGPLLTDERLHRALVAYKASRHPYRERAEHLEAAKASAMEAAAREGGR